MDGIVGPETIAALKKAMNAEVENPGFVRIVGGDCYVRALPDKNYGKILFWYPNNVLRRFL